MNLVRELKRRWWTMRALFSVPRQIHALVWGTQLARSYFPERERKSRMRVLFDLLWWLLRHREVNHFYYVYGLDLVGAREERLVAGKVFRERRDQHNRRPRVQFSYYQGRYDYLCLTRDKYLFGQFLSGIGVVAPRNLAIASRDRITWADGRGSQPMEVLTDPKLSFDGFCKPLDGILGQDVFTLRIEGGVLEVDGEIVDAMEFGCRLRSRYLIQERITQHPEIARLYPQAINTVRVVTVRSADTIDVFAVTLRMGAHGIHTDNWASGGIIVRVDPASGRLQGDGFFKPGKGLRVSVHPDSGVVLEGFQIPFFQQVIATAKRCHEYFYGLHSVGWDVAVTPQGPTVIEGNDDWDGAIPMTLETDFRRRFLAAFPAIDD